MKHYFDLPLEVEEIEHCNQCHNLQITPFLFVMPLTMLWKWLYHDHEVGRHLLDYKLHVFHNIFPTSWWLCFNIASKFSTPHFEMPHSFYLQGPSNPLQAWVVYNSPNISLPIEWSSFPIWHASITSCQPFRKLKHP